MYINMSRHLYLVSIIYIENENTLRGEMDTGRNKVVRSQKYNIYLLYLNHYACELNSRVL